MRTKLMLFMLAAITLTACSSDDSVEDNKTVNPKLTYRLEVQAENGAKTRLSLDETGKVLTPYWKGPDSENDKGEKVGVHVYSDNGFEDEETVNYVGFVSANEDGNPTTFIGDVNELPGWNSLNASGTKLLFTFPNFGSDGYQLSFDSQYLKQDGTIQTLATHFDFASATAVVDRFEKEQGGDKLYIMLMGGNKIVFQNHTAITAFSFKDKDGNELEVSYFEVNGKGLVKDLDLYEYYFNLDKNKEPYFCFHDDASTPLKGTGLFFNPVSFPSTVYVSMLNKDTSQKTEYTFFVSARKKGYSLVESYKCKMKANLQPGFFYSTTLVMKKVSDWNEEI